MVRMVFTFLKKYKRKGKTTEKEEYVTTDRMRSTKLDLLPGFLGQEKGTTEDDMAGWHH